MAIVHVDISDVTISHFAQSGELPSEVLRMNSDQIEELIDAIPDDNPDLIDKLRILLRG